MSEDDAESASEAGTERDAATESGGEDGPERTPADDVEAVGDGRKKHVSVRTRAGKEFDHGDVYLRHSETEFVVSPDAEFPPDETTRYRKADLARVDVTQHHSSCFVTTATAGEGRTLSLLREFRDDVMAPSRAGRGLLVVYDAVSPPVAATLAAHPDATGTRAVRRLVERCGSLADRRRRAAPAGRVALSCALVALYVVGVCLALAVHGWLSLRERGLNRKSA